MRTPNYTNRIKMEPKNDIFEGQSIEELVYQATTTNQTIEQGAPLIFTARKDGVIYEYNIRSDKFDRAMEMMDKYSKAVTEKRAEIHKKQEEEVGKPEPTQASQSEQTENAVNQ